MASAATQHPGSIVTGRADLHAKPQAKHRWWDTVDPTYPVHVYRDPELKMGADDKGFCKNVGFPVQTEWSGSWREFMSEDARPKPNTMSSLQYTMQQSADSYIFNVSTHWKLADTQIHFDEVTVGEYRPVAYAYITGPPPKRGANYPHDGPRGEVDMNRGRITLPRGADMARLRQAETLREFADLSDGTLVLTIPKAPKQDSSAPTPEYIAPEDSGAAQQRRKMAAIEEATLKWG